MSPGVAAVQSAQVADIGVGAAVVALLIALQLRTRPVRERSPMRVVLVLGVVAALTVTIWGEASGPAMGKGTTLTAVVWVLSFGVHLGFEAGIDQSAKMAGLGASTVLLSLAVTLAAQREFRRRRAAGIEGPGRAGCGDLVLTRRERWPDRGPTARAGRSAMMVWCTWERSRSSFTSLLPARSRPSGR